MTPLPVAEDFDAFNARLLDACTKRRQAILRGHTALIAERMQADLEAFMTLPPAPMTPVTKSPLGSPPCRSCATRTTITRRRRATAIKRFWRRDMSTGLRSSAGVRRSLCIRAATRRPISLTTPALPALSGVAVLSLSAGRDRRDNRSARLSWPHRRLRLRFSGSGGTGMTLSQETAAR